ncbi:MAG: DUF2071 domain-containing protein [Armatimonadetes bacterium]|nr:DUF2071 domain-containing protein [Armatimonadota bacterium]
MHQTWRNLIFLHWEVPADALQKLLPPGLTVETWEGKAYVGLVPFQMDNIRFHRLPAIPGTNRFWETNLRTYVIGPDGDPGVWFLSLDASNWPAVVTARAWFGLPYHFAKMSGEWTEDWHYRSSRRDAMVDVCVSDVPDVFAPAEPGTFEFWAAERYALYSFNRGKIYKGIVHHVPYPLASVPVSNLSCETTLFEAGGIAQPLGEPSILVSSGVDVEVFSPFPVRI